MIDGDISLRQALARFFELNEFPPDGGYDDKWVISRLGPFPVGLPNLRNRRKGVQRHDLHHVLTGYATDLPGEAEICAWELGHGYRSLWSLWILGLTDFILGVGIWPQRTVRAYLRGRRTHNLYEYELPYTEELLDTKVVDARRRLGLGDSAATGIAVPDIARLVIMLLVAPLAALAEGLVVLATMPGWLPQARRTARRRIAGATSA